MHDRRQRRHDAGKHQQQQARIERDRRVLREDGDDQRQQSCDRETVKRQPHRCQHHQCRGDHAADGKHHQHLIDKLAAGQQQGAQHAPGRPHDGGAGDETAAPHGDFTVRRRLRHEPPIERVTCTGHGSHQCQPQQKLRERFDREQRDRDHCRIEQRTEIARPRQAIKQAHPLIEHRGISGHQCGSGGIRVGLRIHAALPLMQTPRNRLSARRRRWRRPCAVCFAPCGCWRCRSCGRRAEPSRGRRARPAPSLRQSRARAQCRRRSG